MKGFCALLLAVCLLLSGCAMASQTRHTVSFLDLFDTVTTIVGFRESKADFEALAQQIHDDLQYYHQLFDIYHEYEGLNNLKTVNSQAGVAPVVVDGAIVELLKDCKSYYDLTGGKVNVAFGSVLQLWHQARKDANEDPENAYVPPQEALEDASAHTDMDGVILDEAASTVYLSDPRLQLDVGAIAKGWAAQKVCQAAPAGLLVSVGGNVCATGPKADGSPWVVGIQDPDDGNAYLHTLNISHGCVATSGDYQRAYTVHGKLYHHIIDPETLAPGGYWQSVSIVCADSGLADALSTALFLLPQQEGQALLDRWGALAIWVDHEGNILYSPGFQDLIKR